MTRILVVDDEPKIRSMITSCLELDGFEVVGVESGQQALERIAQSPPHLMLLDRRLGDRSGLAVLRQARKSLPQVLAFMLTGFDDDQLEHQAAELGALGVIHKPLVIPELRKTVKDAVSKLPPA